MKEIYMQHNKKCFACQEEVNKVALGYDIKTMKSYHLDPEECGNPEKWAEMVDQETELVFATTAALKHAIDENYTPDAALSFNKIIGKSISVRVTPALAMHILKTAQLNNYKSVNETLTNILTRDMEAYEVAEELKGSNFSHKRAPKARTVTVEEITAPPADIHDEVEKAREEAQAKLQHPVIPEPEVKEPEKDVKEDDDDEWEI